MSWETTDVLSADTTDVLSADTTDVLSADTTDVLSADTTGVLSADTRNLCVPETTLPQGLFSPGKKPLSGRGNAPAVFFPEKMLISLRFRRGHIDFDSLTATQRNHGQERVYGPNSLPYPSKNPL